jgi:lysozyme
MAMQKSLKAVLVSSALGAAAIVAANVITIPSEGEKHIAYLDGGKIPTICNGHTKGVYMGMVATDEQCKQFIIEDLKDAEKAYDRNIHIEAPENVKASAIDFIYNVGPGNFASSTLRKKINARKFVEACNEYPRWKFQGPLNCELSVNAKICGGLPIRRKREKDLCLDKVHYDFFSIGADNILRGVKAAPVASDGNKPGVAAEAGHAKNNVRK